MTFLLLWLGHTPPPEKVLVHKHPKGVIACQIKEYPPIGTFDDGITLITHQVRSPKRYLGVSPALRLAISPCKSDVRVIVAKIRV